ncbi:MAG TPA: ribulose-phosphate 3-epimerase [Tepiditoga sp.]|nr:ribulose-phosphate 3-epimerase [Thermotogota bacterium]HOO75803.1 ribulose-phosphate 3-epimerase [Tepiditoga sp.]
MIKIYPSLLSADFSDLKKDIKKVSNADGLHLDIMDGSFVPNISFGFPVLKSIRPITDMFFDTHLMIDNPEKYIPEFAKYSDSVTIHYETTNHLNRAVSMIKENNCLAGVSVNPHTPVSLLEEIIPFIDCVLVMSVNPGFGGQKFIETSYAKIRKLKALKDELNPELEIIVDGGVDTGNIRELFNCGATVFVAGSSVYGSDNPSEKIDILKGMIE